MNAILSPRLLELQPLVDTTPTGSQAQHAPTALSDPLVELGALLAPHLGGLNVGGTLVVGLGEHAHDGDENFLDALDGRPALRRLLVVVGIVARRVQDRDADQAARINCDVSACACIFLDGFRDFFVVPG
jgi:hypothetical protein